MISVVKITQIHTFLILYSENIVMEVIRDAGINSRMLSLQSLPVAYFLFLYCMPDEAREGRNIALK